MGFNGTDVFHRMTATQSSDFEQLVYCSDSRTGLRAIISMHSTVLGPATGGCRMWAYGSEQEALTDVLRLSQGMTYKASISGLNWGGGKAVILAKPGVDPQLQKTPELLHRFGEFVNRLGGNYITAKDVGINSEDLRQVKTRTPHVLGIDGQAGSSGDPSPATAFGVYHGMRSAAQFAFGSNSLSGLTVALQGLGSVSFHLMEYLSAEGAKLVGCDISQGAIARATEKYEIQIVRPEVIHDVACDIFSPSALGASINPESVGRIRAKVVAGAANNQLATPVMGEELLRLGIVYAPDYALNAGGLINIYHERMIEGGYDRGRAFDHVAQIAATITEILNRAKSEKIPPHLIADKMAEERVESARALRPSLCPPSMIGS